MSNNFDVTLPALELAVGEGMVVAGVLPLPTVLSIITVQNVVDVAMTLPWPMTLAASFQGFTAAPELPALAGGSIAGTVPNLVRVAGTLPVLAAGTIHGFVGGLSNVAGALHLPTVVMTRGSAYAPVLPSLTGSAHVQPNLALVFAVTLPSLDGAAAGTNAQHTLHAPLMILPALAGISGQMNSAPALPALHGVAVIVAGTAAVRQAWVMNTKNLAMTQYANFPFRAFARAYERYYAVGLDGGFHLMGGDKDLTAPISWQWRTGRSDLGSRAGKGVLALYVDGIAERGCEFEVVTDRGDYWYTHQPHGTQNDYQTQRVPIGKALRSVNWEFGMRSTKGAYFEIDSIAPEWQISERNLY